MRIAVVAFILGLVIGGLGMVIIGSDSESAPNDGARVSMPKELSGERRRAIDNADASSINPSDWGAYSPEELDERLSELSSDEGRKLIASILASVDPIAGIGRKEKRLLGAILEQLSMESFDDTVDWIESTFTQGTRSGLLSELTVKLAYHDYLAAVSFAGQHLAEQEREKLASKLLEMGAYRKTDWAIAALELVSIRSGNRSGSQIKWAEDFDFREFGEAAYQLAVKGREKGTFSRFPSNFLEEWAKRAPNDAIDFYRDYLAEEDLLPFNDLMDLSEGYLSTADPEISAEWLSGMLEGEDLSEDERKMLLRSAIEIEKKSTEILNQMIDRRGEPVEAAALASELLDVTSNRMGGTVSNDQLRILKLFPDPESRMSHLVESGVTYRAYREDMGRHLIDLGHSQSEVDQFMESSKRK